MNSNLHSERLSLTLYDILMPSGAPSSEPDIYWTDFPQAVPTNFVGMFRIFLFSSTACSRVKDLFI